MKADRIALPILILAVALMSCEVVSAVTLPNIASLTAHFDAGAGVTFSSETSISQWADQQTSDGFSSDVFQDSTNLQPKLISGAVNGLPAVRFDGDTSSLGVNADYMKSTDTMDHMITRPKYTAFVVFRPNAIFRGSTAPSTAFVNDAVYADSNGYLGLHLRKSPSNQLYAYSFHSSDEIAAVSDTTTPVGSGDFQLATVVHNVPTGGLGTLSLDLYKHGSATFTPSDTTGIITGNLMLGAGAVLSQTIFRGDIAEVLFYNDALSTPNIAAVQRYLIEKYDLPEPSSAAILVFGTALATLRRKSSRVA